MVVTETQAKEIRDALRLLEQKENQARQTKFNSDLATAQSWYDSLNLAIPVNRDEALIHYKNIELMLKTETNPLRKRILTIELKKANEKFKELKKAKVV